MSSAPGRKVKVAVCQMTSTEDVQYNLKISCDVVRKAVEAGAKVSLLQGHNAAAVRVDF
jgi:predicted amidohydrolase